MTKKDDQKGVAPKPAALMIKAAIENEPPKNIEELVSQISRYLRVLKPIIDGALLTDSESNVLWADASMLSLCGFKLEELQEKGLGLIFPGYLDQGAHKRWVKSMAHGSSVNMGDRKSLKLQRSRKDPLDIQIGAVACTFFDVNCRIAVVKKYSPPAIPGPIGGVLETFNAVLGIFVKQPVYSALVALVMVCYFNWGAIRNDVIGLSQFVLNRKCAPLNLPEELKPQGD